MLAEANKGKALPMAEGQEHCEGYSPKTHTHSACLRMRLKTLRKTFSLTHISIRAFNTLTTIILNSLSDSFITCVISGYGPNDCFVSSDCVSCLFVCIPILCQKSDMLYRTVGTKVNIL